MSENNLMVKHYKSLARSYDSRFREYVAATANKVVELSNITPGAQVLDLGCGTGETLLVLARKYPDVGLLAGIDTSAEMLQLAETKLATYESIDLRLGTIEKLPYPDEHFDLIVSSGVLHYIEDIDSMTSEAFRVLKPHGHIIFIDMAKESLATKISSLFRRVIDPGTVRYYSLHSVSELLDSQGFKTLSTELFQAGLYGLFLIEGVKS